MSKPDRIERIVNSLDLGFSDFYKGENVRQLTLEKKLDRMENAESFETIEEYMNYSVSIERDQPSYCRDLRH